MDGQFIRGALKWEVICFEGEYMVRCTFPDGTAAWGSLEGADIECDTLRAVIDAHKAGRGQVVPIHPK